MVETFVDRPPGWFLRCETPTDLTALIEWLAIRAAWLREYHAGRVGERFNPDFADVIRRELPFADWVDSEPCELVARYFRDLITNVAYWLETRGPPGYPNWTTPADDDPRQLIEADDFLSSLMNWLRSFASGGSIVVPFADSDGNVESSVDLSGKSRQNELSLDMRAMLLFAEKRKVGEFPTKKVLAGELDCHEKSLAKGRCPMLDTMIKRDKAAAQAAIPRGSKSFGTIEAVDSDEDADR
jgi:hypothetical protein